MTIDSIHPSQAPNEVIQLENSKPTQFLQFAANRLTICSSKFWTKIVRSCAFSGAPASGLSILTQFKLRSLNRAFDSSRGIEISFAKLYHSSVDLRAWVGCRLSRSSCRQQRVSGRCILPLIRAISAGK